MAQPIEAVALIGSDDPAIHAAVRHAARSEGRTIHRVVSTRAELEDLLDGDGGGALGAVYFHRLGDLGDQVFDAHALLMRLAGNGIGFASVIEEVSSQRLGEAERVLAVLASACEMDHRKLVRTLQTQFALRRRKAGGKRKTGGQRYGERPFEDEVIAYIVRLRVQGLSVQRICDRLNAEGIPASKRYGRWHRKVVERLLRHTLPTRGGPDIGGGRLSAPELQRLLGITHHVWYAELRKDKALLTMLDYRPFGIGADRRLSADAQRAAEFATWWRPKAKQRRPFERLLPGQPPEA